MAKKKFITINGNRYGLKEFDFNTVCDFEQLGISFEDIGTKPMSMVRAYAGICMGMNAEDTGKELEQHIINGGNFNDIISVISYELENSDFFRNLNKGTEEEA